MTRPAIGCTRVSTGPQARQYGQEVQAQEITAYAARTGYDLLEIVPEVISGKKELDDRATVQRYFDLAAQTKGLTFIFPRVDRIGRRAELILNIVRELQQRGANVEVVGVPLDLRTKEGTLMLTVLAGIAEYDHANLTNNTVQGQRRKAQAGLWPHGSVPWAYEMERDTRGVGLRPRPIPERAAAIRRAFELALEGGETYVMQTMQREGWPAPTAAGWGRKTVVHALTNPIYTGRRTWQGFTLEFEPIVSPDVFAQVQQQRQTRRGPGRTPGTAEPLLFTGHLFCTCGSAMGRDVARSRNARQGLLYEKYAVYRCWKAKKPELRGPGPHASQVRAELMDAQLWPALVTILTDPEQLAALVSTDDTPAGPPAHRVQELEAAIERAYEPLTAGAPGYTLAMAQNLARPYADELARLRAEAAQQTRERAGVDVAERAETFRVMLQAGMNQDEQRQLLASLNVRVTVGPEGLENIVLNVP